MKPWDPPEQRLYPVLDDLLAEWSGRVPARVRGHPHRRVALVAAELQRARVSRAQPGAVPVDRSRSRRAVARAGDVDRGRSAEAAGGAVSRRHGARRADDDPSWRRRSGCTPRRRGRSTTSRSSAADRPGSPTPSTRASEGLQTILIEQAAPGGQAGTSSLIENYLGFPAGVTGADLAQRAAAQARRFGAELLVGHAVTGVRREDPYRIVQLTERPRDLVSRARDRHGHVGPRRSTCRGSTRSSAPAPTTAPR